MSAVRCDPLPQTAFQCNKQLKRSGNLKVTSSEQSQQACGSDFGARCLSLLGVQCMGGGGTLGVHMLVQVQRNRDETETEMKNFMQEVKGTSFE